MTQLVVEGWRFIAHSYAVVNQFQCLALGRRADITLAHRDAPYFNPAWRPEAGMFPPAHEAALRSLPAPAPDDRFDVVYRIASPYDVSPSTAAPRTFVFGTAELGMVPAHYVTGQSALRDASPSVHIVTPSVWSRAGFVRSGFADERVHVVPHGIDPTLLRAPPDDQRALTRARLGWQPDETVFLHVGAMTPNKGLPTLLQAFATVVDRHPRARLALKGADFLYASRALLDGCVRDLPEDQKQRIGERLLYMGTPLSFADMADLYGACDAYVAPYLAEGFNLPVLEAMACGRPVICTAGGATDDFVDDGTGFRIASDLRPAPGAQGTPGGVVRSPSLDHLIALMLSIVEDPTRARAIGAAAATRAHTRFTWQTVVNTLCGVLGVA